METIVTTLVSTLAFISLAFCAVAFWERKADKDKLNEETKWPRSWNESDEWGW